MHPFARAVAGFLPLGGAKGARILVALSGGPDSTALLLALHEAEQTGALGAAARLMGAAHFHHGLRGRDADADAAFAAATCAALGLPCRIGLGAVGARREAAHGQSRLSPNNAARGARYAFLREAAGEMNATHVATAHTSDDQAETVLLRVLRGTSVDGLAAIPARRTLPGSGGDEDVTLIRPLLKQTRTAVEAYLADRGVSARRDPTNDDARYARSRVRRLLPRLAHVVQNPRLGDALNRLARAAALDANLLNCLADDLWRTAATLAPRQVWLDVPALCAAPPALRRRVLIRALRHVAAPLWGGGEDAKVDVASMESVDRVENLLLSPGGGVAVGGRGVDLPGGVRVGHAAGAARLVMEARPAPGTAYKTRTTYSYLLPLPGSVWVALAQLWVRATLVSGEAAAPMSSAGRRALAVTLALPDGGNRRDTINLGEPEAVESLLEVRPGRIGERFTPLGMAGRTRLVRDVLADAGWACALREMAPVVARRDTGEILWIVGVAQSESSRVTADAFSLPAPRAAHWLLHLTAAPGC